LAPGILQQIVLRVGLIQVIPKVEGAKSPPENIKKYGFIVEKKLLLVKANTFIVL
jgi:hypothetical protein